MRHIYGNELVNSEGKLFHCTSWKPIGEAKLRIHSFLPSSLYEGDCQPYVTIALPHEKHPLLVVNVETGLDPQPVWTSRRRGKFFRHSP